jgi:predicted RNA-binding Zn-ribbon protein involved in translation (DUF1610 family)
MLIGVVLMVVVIALVVVGLMSAFRRGRGSSSLGESKPQAATGVTLDCPHCGQETEAAVHVCSHCGEEL